LQGDEPVTDRSYNVAIVVCHIHITQVSSVSIKHNIRNNIRNNKNIIKKSFDTTERY